MFRGRRASEASAGALAELPADIWQLVADLFCPKEWAQKCSLACRAFSNIKPRNIYIGGCLNARAVQALAQACQTWQRARTITIDLKGFFINYVIQVSLAATLFNK